MIHVYDHHDTVYTVCYDRGSSTTTARFLINNIAFFHENCFLSLRQVAKYQRASSYLCVQCNSAKFSRLPDAEIVERGAFYVEATLQYSYSPEKIPLIIIRDVF